MRISLSTSSINFKRQLRPDEEAEYLDVLQKGKQKVGNTGKAILIVPSASLPQELSSGVGNLLDKEGQKFIDFAKLYWGINCVQLLPEGEYKISKDSRILPYSGSALSLGTHIINPELLTTEEFGKILTQEDIKHIVNANKSSQVNFENVIFQNSSTDKVLRKAYDNLLKADTESKRRILSELELYSKQNSNWLEPKAVFAALCKKYKSNSPDKWNEFDRNLYNEEIVPLNKRLSAIQGIRNCELGKEADFYEFKQFMAETHFAKARKLLNEKNLKLSGDVLIGFSTDEVWANPKAFIKNATVNWGLPALNYESKEGENLLRQKFNLFAKRYDNLRIDASWIYAAEPVKDSVTGAKYKKEYDAKVLEIIDDEIKKVKGKQYKSEDIMHEFISKLEDFNIYDGTTIKPFVAKRTKIYCTNVMHNNWGTVDNFQRRGWADGSYVLGTTNHDCILMKKQYAEFSARKNQAEVLSEILKIPQEKLQSLNDFIKAKFAEPMRSKHNMIFFSDALNLDGQYKENTIESLDYRLKIPENYKKHYFESLEKGEGFNVMDALEKAFVSKGLDKTEPELYKNIVKYQKILQGIENNETKGFNKINLAIGIGIGIILGLICLALESKKKADNIGS